MKIGLIIYGELTRTTGRHVYARQLVHALSQLEHELDVIELPERDYGRHVLDNFSLSLRRQLKKAPYDVLLQDESNHPSLFFLNQTLKQRGRYPLVSLVHSLRCQRSWPELEKKLYTSVEREYLRTLDGLVVKSVQAREGVFELIEQSLPSLVAPPGRDHFESRVSKELAEERARLKGPLHLLFLGDVVWSRGLHFLLAGIAQLPKGAVRLDVVGNLQLEPTYVRETQATIVREGLTQVVTLWGPLRGDALFERLQLAQALAITSELEGARLAYLEAMGFYLPAVGSDDGSAADLIENGVEGFLVNRRRPDEVAAAIQTWVDDRECLLRMGIAAREKYLEQPTWSQTGARVASFLEECVERFKKA